MMSKPFAALTAADVMTRHPVVLTPEIPLREAARMLLQTFISGAPVVDHAGRCIGILSSIDFVRLVWLNEPMPPEWSGSRANAYDSSTTDAAERAAAANWALGTCEARQDSDFEAAAVMEWQIVDQALPPEATVATLMTRDAVMMPESASVAELARKLLASHLHRLVIVDDNEKPVGIVSGSDLLAAVAAHLGAANEPAAALSS